MLKSSGGKKTYSGEFILQIQQTLQFLRLKPLHSMFVTFCLLSHVPLSNICEFQIWPFCLQRGYWHKTGIATFQPVTDVSWVSASRHTYVVILCTKTKKTAKVQLFASIRSDPSMIRGIPTSDCGFMTSNT